MKTHTMKIALEGTTYVINVPIAQNIKAIGEGDEIVLPQHAVDSKRKPSLTADPTPKKAAKGGKGGKGGKAGKGRGKRA